MSNVPPPLNSNNLGSNLPPGTPFDADKPVGLVVIVLHLCCMLAGMAVAGVISALGFSLGSSVPAEVPMPTHFFATFGLPMVAGLFVIGISSLGVGCGWGIFKSRKWGFWIGVVVFGVAAAGDLSGGATAFGAILHIGGFIYCLMRLIGKLGPLPQ